MTEGVIIALVGAVGLLPGALYNGWIGGDTRRARQDERKRDQARQLIKATVEQGVEQLLADLRREPLLQGISFSGEKFVEPIRAILELHLDASSEVIEAKLKAQREALFLLDMTMLRFVMPLTENFAVWCEKHTPTLIAIRRDLGFSRADCDRLQAVWDEHYALFHAALARVRQP